MTISPQTRNWLRQSAALDGAVVSQTLLNLLERVEALEQRSTCKQSLQVPPTPEPAPEVATDEELWSLWANTPIIVPNSATALRALYNLGRQHGAQPPAAQPAQSAPPVAPAGGLVERVGLLLQQLSAPAQAVVPVAVSERLPKDGDCDAEGRCWIHQPHPATPETPEWRLAQVKYASVNYGTTHWAAAHAIPLPQAGEVEG